MFFYFKLFFLGAEGLFIKFLWSGIVVCCCCLLLLWIVVIFFCRH